MEVKNSVYIGTSLDGFIADNMGGLAWLDSIPNPDQIDMGYTAFMDQIDALVMGRVTFETVCSFDIEWPYTKPVFVLSHALKEVPAGLEDKVFLVKGSLTEILNQIHEKGFYNLYIDGGRTIQNFLQADLIDEMIITIIPILLGGGTPLFGSLQKPLNFFCSKTTIFLDKIVQNHFIRERKNQDE